MRSQSRRVGPRHDHFADTMSFIRSGEAGKCAAEVPAQGSAVVGPLSAARARARAADHAFDRSSRQRQQLTRSTMPRRVNITDQRQGGRVLRDDVGLRASGSGEPGSSTIRAWTRKLDCETELADGDRQDRDADIPRREGPGACLRLHDLRRCFGARPAGAAESPEGFTLVRGGPRQNASTRALRSGPCIVTADEVGDPREAEASGRASTAS